jgi:hypothetical protein
MARYNIYTYLSFYVGHAGHVCQKHIFTKKDSIIVERGSITRFKTINLFRRQNIHRDINGTANCKETIYKRGAARL